jgi:hypothetical protein
MTPDLQLLVWSASLALVQMLIAVIGAQGQVSLPVLVVNREAMPALTGWVGRAQRAHLNPCWRAWQCSPSPCWSRTSPAGRRKPWAETKHKAFRSGIKSVWKS